jgi:putative addiction module killer protein
LAPGFAGYPGKGKDRRKDRPAGARNPGDVAPVGGGISEMRIHYGPGYRVYFVRRGANIVVLLCGGDKGSQASDIAMAKKLASELED